MDYAIITTAKDVELSSRLSHLYMVLAWLCKEDPQYKAYFINAKQRYNDSYTILDNGANENKLCEPEEIINVAYDLFADEIIAPDVYGDYVGTKDKTQEFLSKYYDKYLKDKFNIMGVIQGDTEESFLNCFNYYLNEPKIGVIGIGYRNLLKPFKSKMIEVTDETWNEIGIDNVPFLKSKLTEDTFYYTLSRIYFLKKYEDLIYSLKDKKIHLLGLTNPYEMSLYNKIFSQKFLNKIRGCDSACLSQAAQASVIFNKEYGVIQKPKNILDFHEGLSTSQRFIFEENLKIFKKWTEIRR